MEIKLETVAKSIESVQVNFFKYLYRTDPNKIENGIGRTHIELLTALSVAEQDGDKISLSEIANRLLISRAYTTALTDKLVQRGLIERIPDPDDRRSVRIILTEKGKSVLETKQNEHITSYKKRISCLSDSDLDLLADSLAHIENILPKIGIDDI